MKTLFAVYLVVALIASPTLGQQRKETPLVPEGFKQWDAASQQQYWAAFEELQDHYKIAATEDDVKPRKTSASSGGSNGHSESSTAKVRSYGVLHPSRSPKAHQDLGEENATRRLISKYEKLPAGRLFKSDQDAPGGAASKKTYGDSSSPSITDLMTGAGASPIELGSSDFELVRPLLDKSDTPLDYDVTNILLNGEYPKLSELDYLRSDRDAARMLAHRNELLKNKTQQGWPLGIIGMTIGGAILVLGFLAAAAGNSVPAAHTAYKAQRASPSYHQRTLAR